jgi:hypothetical protein
VKEPASPSVFFLDAAIVPEFLEAIQEQLTKSGGQIINATGIRNSTISTPEAGLDILAAGSDVDG